MNALELLLCCCANQHPTRSGVCFPSVFYRIHLKPPSKAIQTIRFQSVLNASQMHLYLALYLDPMSHEVITCKWGHGDVQCEGQKLRSWLKSSNTTYFNSFNQSLHIVGVIVGLFCFGRLQNLSDAAPPTAAVQKGLHTLSDDLTSTFLEAYWGIYF